jgi:hypothetical protein
MKFQPKEVIYKTTNQLKMGAPHQQDKPFAIRENYLTKDKSKLDQYRYLKNKFIIIINL